MSQQDLTEEQLNKLNAAAQNGADSFMLGLGNVTAWQATQYEQHPLAQADCSFWVWSYCVTWGFEMMWASLMQSTAEEVEKLREEGMDVEIPEGFDPHVPLKEIDLWAPQDHMTRLCKG